MASRLSPLAKEILAAGALAWSWVGRAGMPVAVAQAEPPGVIIVEVALPSDGFDAESLRAAIASELGIIAVSPWDARAPTSRGTIRVRLDGSMLEVEYEERHTIRRRVPAPSNAAATERAAAFLAGNLARHEASDIASWLAQEALFRPRAPEVTVDAPTPEPAERPMSEPTTPRAWVGLSAEMDLMSFDGAHYTPDGSVAFTGNPTGVGLNGRVLIDADYAISDHALLGLSAGVMFRRYPGPMGSGVNVDRFHVEGRATLGSLDGQWAPYFCSGLGTANFDAEQDSGGLQVWTTHGPLFVMAGFGFRMPFSRTTAAMIAPIKLTLVFPHDAALLWSPEVSMKLGF
jgi:hypothetical protein